MQKVRVFKLASDLGMKNDAMVSKIQEYGIQVKNYMSCLTEEDARQVKTKLRKERDSQTVEEHIRPTVVRRRTQTRVPLRPDVTPGDIEAPPTDEGGQSVEPLVSSSDASIGGPETVGTPSVTEELFPSVDADASATDAAESGDSSMEEQAAPEPKAAPTLNDELTSAFGQSAESAEESSPETRSSVVPDSVRPASEAPLIKRRLQQEEIVKNIKKGAARRRKVESREMKPSRAGTVVSTPAGSPAAAPGRKRKMSPGKQGKKTEITTPKAIKRKIKIEEQVTLQDLARRMSVKSTELLMKLMSMGLTNININSTLDLDTAKIIAEEFGYDVENVAVVEDDLLAQTRSEETDEERAKRVGRAPVVTMMGHVDHGKTSLLDYIRSAKVADGEAGGITQHVGAYRAKTAIGEITFIDTPGHAAFTAMRSRGADLTDIVVIVCAADDGVMPQTIEAIEHARVSKCPMIVAINKCDMPTADVDRTKRTLMEHGLFPESLGGDTIIVEVSAKTGDGIDGLLEMISLQAEIMELDANPERPAAGVVLEAYLDKGRGPVAHVLVQEGTLDASDIVVAGQAFGKIRVMTDERGQKIKSAGPSTPVEILGLSDVPAAGDTFDVVNDAKIAEKVANSREQKERSSVVATTKPSLDALYRQMQTGEQAELKLLIKADVRGTMEAIRESLEKLSAEKVKVTVVSASVGGITESDVLLASTADAIIIGFNVRPAGKAKKLADEQGIEIKIFSVIYDIIDAIESAMIGLLEPEIRHRVIGMAQVREVFRIPKIGTIAGSYVTEGKVSRNGFARLIRDSIQIWEGEVDSLRRFKDDVKEVSSGYECGIGLKGFNDIKENDVVEFYLKEEVEATLN